MSKISFTLNAFNKVTVYDLKHRPYRLHGGINHMELEYEDYVLLIKALGMTPMPNPEEAKPIEDLEIEEVSTEAIVAEKPTDELKDEESKTHEQAAEEYTTSDNVGDEIASEESVVEEHEKENTVDYSTWSYTKLKNEYKRITGKSCKLKKEEVIEFLQEQQNV